MSGFKRVRVQDVSIEREREALDLFRDQVVRRYSGLAKREARRKEVSYATSWRDLSRDARRLTENKNFPWTVNALTIKKIFRELEIFEELKASGIRVRSNGMGRGIVVFDALELPSKELTASA